jgi:hypothetical protein
MLMRFNVIGTATRGSLPRSEAKSAAAVPGGGDIPGVAIHGSRNRHLWEIALLQDLIKGDEP